MKTNIKNLFLLPALVAGLGLILAGRVTAQTFTNLHSFAAVNRAVSTNSDGAYPEAGLILSGTTFYGTASQGGSSGWGTVFKVNTNGTGFTILHSFTNGSDGASPYGGLVLSGNTLYGTTYEGGSSGWGAVFALNTDGSAFTNLHSFTAPDINTRTNSDGVYPSAGLILSGNTLYGTAAYGGSSGWGTVFKLNTDGSGFTNLHSFTNGSDGAIPEAGLILSGNALYGTTYEGGSSGNGTVFSVNTDGSGFTNLHRFSAGKIDQDLENYTNSEGANPRAGLVLSGNTLFGTASQGGSSGLGTVFKLNTDGSGFTNLHSITGYFNEGAFLNGGLILSANTLYGTTVEGGFYGGTVFSINTDGTGFTTLYEFSGGSDGGFPEAGLILSANALYGTASQGGSGGNGALFSINTNGTGFTTFYSFTALVPPDDSNSDGINPLAGLILSGNTLFGTAPSGGSSLNGTVFRVNTDGSGFTNLHSFTALDINTQTINTDGASPSAGLVLSGNTLFGTAQSGGSSGNGTVFAVKTDGSGFTNLHSFTALDINTQTNSDGASPSAGLILSGNTLFGTAAYGGSADKGTAFAVNTDGTGFTNLHSFTAGQYYNDGNHEFYINSDGAFPRAGLILSGNTLFGTAASGGTNGSGTVFALNTDGTGYTTLHVFTAPSGILGYEENGTNSDGASPSAGLILSGNILFGTAAYGGSSGYGTVFKVNTDGTGFTNLHSFTATLSGTNSDGSLPSAGLILSGNILFGTALYGGYSGNGTVFAVNTNGTGFTTLHVFTAPSGTLGYSGNGTNSDGQYPLGGLVLSGNTLFGTAEDGGNWGNGTVFSISLTPPPLAIMRSGTNVVLTWPTYAPGVTLQSTTNLIPPAVWPTVTPAPSLVNGQNAVTNPIFGAQMFYRLSQ